MWKLRYSQSPGPNTWTETVLSCWRELIGVGDQTVFFAISHGKSPCDRVGVKRLLARASLPVTVNNQILKQHDEAVQLGER